MATASAVEAARDAMCAAADPLAVFVADGSLWGDLAGNALLRDAIAAAAVDLRTMLAT